MRRGIGLIDTANPHLKPSSDHKVKDQQDKMNSSVTKLIEKPASETARYQRKSGGTPRQIQAVPANARPFTNEARPLPTRDRGSGCRNGEENRRRREVDEIRHFRNRKYQTVKDRLWDDH